MNSFVFPAKPKEKIQKAEDAWNSKNPENVSKGATISLYSAIIKNWERIQETGERGSHYKFRIREEQERE